QFLNFPEAAHRSAQPFETHPSCVFPLAVFQPLHAKGILELVAFCNSSFLNEPRFCLYHIPNVFGWWPEKRARILSTWLGMLQHMHHVMTLVHPQNVDRESISLGCYAMHPVLLKDIKHASVRRQCIAKGKPKKQLLRRVSHFGFQFNTARKCDDDDARFLAFDKENRSAHQEKGEQSHHDDPLFSLFSIARFGLIIRYHCDMGRSFLSPLSPSAEPLR